MNTQGDLELPANWAEPENQAEPVLRPDTVRSEKFPIFSQIIKPTTFLIQHEKGHSDSSIYVKKRGIPHFTLIVGYPVDRQKQDSVEGFSAAVQSLFDTHTHTHKYVWGFGSALFAKLKF